MGPGSHTPFLEASRIHLVSGSAALHCMGGQNTSMVRHVVSVILDRFCRALKLCSISKKYAVYYIALIAEPRASTASTHCL